MEDGGLETSIAILRHNKITIYRLLDNSIFAKYCPKTQKVCTKVCTFCNPVYGTFLKNRFCLLSFNCYFGKNRI